MAQQSNPASSTAAFVPVSCSLSDLLGLDAVQAVCAARSTVSGESEAELRALASEPVDFFPQSFQARLAALLPRVGLAVTQPLLGSRPGATTRPWAAASHLPSAPLTGLGYYRVGEDGRLALITKSEHYHAPLGHVFPGYRLIERAKALGVPNATHNNTRGHITRLLEENLLSLANAGAPVTGAPLSRVLNLETGSLACEAAIKLVLHRFHPAQADAAPPKYASRIPVLLVVGDESGGLQANYHGTTLFAQTLRGMWGDLLGTLERAEWMLVRSVRLDDVRHLEELFARYDTGRHKIAAFFHELVLMNYGGRVLSPAFLRRAYQLCLEHDVPTVVDEIQTGMWSPDQLMYREYGLHPSCVTLGKGFPGGEYPASRLLFSADLDTLPQFGALVTNGQEELASLAYLITLRWAQANAEPIERIGEEFERRLRDLVRRRKGLLQEFHGRRHLGGLHFDDVDRAKRFAAKLNQLGLDLSVQSYKTSVPPAAMIKLPLIAGLDVVDLVISKMGQALDEMEGR